MRTSISGTTLEVSELCSSCSRLQWVPIGIQWKLIPRIFWDFSINVYRHPYRDIVWCLPQFKTNDKHLFLLFEQAQVVGCFHFPNNQTAGDCRFSRTRKWFTQQLLWIGNPMDRELFFLFPFTLEMRFSGLRNSLREVWKSTVLPVPGFPGWKSNLWHLCFVTLQKHPLGVEASCAGVDGCLIDPLQLCEGEVQSEENYCAVEFQMFQVIRGWAITIT